MKNYKKLNTSISTIKNTASKGTLGKLLIKTGSLLSNLTFNKYNLIDFAKKSSTEQLKILTALSKLNINNKTSSEVLRLAKIFNIKSNSVPQIKQFINSLHAKSSFNLSEILQQINSPQNIKLSGILQQINSPTNTKSSGVADLLKSAGQFLVDVGKIGVGEKEIGIEVSEWLKFKQAGKGFRNLNEFLTTQEQEFMGATGITSSNVDTIVYQPRTNLMWIRFKNGIWYRYLNVPMETFVKLMTSPSKGEAVWKYIRLGHRLSSAYSYARGSAPPSEALKLIHVEPTKELTK